MRSLVVILRKKKVEALKRQLAEMNQSLVASSGREEGLKDNACS
jgi:nitrate reductase NapAB chaperone NapD